VDVLVHEHAVGKAQRVTHGQCLSAPRLTTALAVDVRGRG